MSLPFPILFPSESEGHGCFAESGCQQQQRRGTSGQLHAIFASEANTISLFRDGVRVVSQVWRQFALAQGVAANATARESQRQDTLPDSDFQAGGADRCFRYARTARNITISMNFGPTPKLLGGRKLGNLSAFGEEHRHCLRAEFPFKCHMMGKGSMQDWAFKEEVQYYKAVR